MKNSSNNLEMLVFIVNNGQARRIIKFGRKIGFSGATVFLGKGTVTQGSKWQKLLDLTDVRKEIVLMLSDHQTVDCAMPLMFEKFKFDKPNHGIAFRMPIEEIIGSMQYADYAKEKEVKEPMYKAIFVIVEKGNAEDVIDAASLAGAQGGTIINARGAGIHETSKVFNMEIEPEKEVVLILSASDVTDKITTSIREVMKIDEPGKGLIFVQDVKEAYGLFNDSKKA